MGRMTASAKVRILHRIGAVIARHAHQPVEVEIRDNGKLI
jgi:hypothetical protein